MEVIVIDNGSYKIRCGISTHLDRSVSTLNLTAAFKRQLPNQKRILFGDEIARVPLTHLTVRSGFEKVCIFTVIGLILIESLEHG